MSHWTGENCRRGAVGIAAAWTILAMPALWAQQAAAPPDASTKVDRIFARYHKTDSPGCAVGAAINGNTVLSAAYGMADLEHDIPLTPSSVFEAGSVSKQFTAAAVLLLAERGKLSLDDPVRKYIPELPDYGKPLTIRNMINHTSGLRDWGNVESIAGWPRTTRTYTHAHVLDIVSRQRELNYPPGAEYSYSNTGFNLAAILVGRVSGKPFPQFEREEIFNPLDMSSTQWRDDYQRIVHNRAIAYMQSNGETRMLMPFEDVYGNGGLLTTVGDLLRWNQNFSNPKVGGPEMVKQQHVQGKLNDGRTIAYAAGLMVLHWKGLNEVSHSGSTAGYRAWLGRYPDNGLSVAVLCNVASANAGQLGHDVADIYLANVLPRKSADPAVTVDAATLRDEAGLYRSVRDHETVSVEVKDGRLQIDRRGALKPVSAYVYNIGESGSQAVFERGGSGKVVRLRMATEVDEGNYYEKVERSTPSRADMQAMTGEYTNDEAETVLKVTLEGSGLVIHRRPDAKIALTPTYKDGFSSSLGSVRFIRDSQGRVTELSIGEQRVWDIRFKRVH